MRRGVEDGLAGAEVGGEGGHETLYFTAFWQGRRKRLRCGASKTAVFARNIVFYNVFEFLASCFAPKLFFITFCATS